MSLPKPACRVQDRERIDRVPPSAERNGHAHSSGFGAAETTQSGPIEGDPGSLPSLPDLLEELDTESVDLNALEQLTQTLLEDIARDLESASEKAAQQEHTANAIRSENQVGQMVGTASEVLEPGRSKKLEDSKSKSTLERDISEYLLLHHNYAKSRPTGKSKSTSRCTKSTPSIRKLKTIRPKHRKIVQMPVESEVLYGTLQPVTILINEDSIPLNEVVIGDDFAVLSQGNTPQNESTLLTVPRHDQGDLSPKSDLGYESIDSPQSCSDVDQWDQSVSELFPSLI